MRTYILSVFDMRAPEQRKKFRCQAATLAEAIQKAEKQHPGLFVALRTQDGGRHASAQP